MAFDETLAARVRKAIGPRAGVVEKKMFGGIAFLLKGNMSVGLHGKELVVRLDPAQGERALSEPNVRRFDITGRPMKGWILVAPSGVASDQALERWVETGLAFAASLPAKD
jgi:TfoX/Sxy family transcriptional regulator of competence genes